MQNTMQSKARPLGLTILGTFNLIILGLFSLLSALSPHSWQIVINAIKEKGIAVTSNNTLFKIAATLQILVSLIFILSGLGLLLGKEWARKATLGFAFFIVIIALLLAAFAPVFIKEAVTQIIYPGILILYLTKKDIEAYFRKDTNFHGSKTNIHE
jgi:hypothetical protein